MAKAKIQLTRAVPRWRSLRRKPILFNRPKIFSSRLLLLADLVAFVARAAAVYSRFALSVVWATAASPGARATASRIMRVIVMVATRRHSIAADLPRFVSVTLAETAKPSRFYISKMAA